MDVYLNVYMLQCTGVCTRTVGRGDFCVCTVGRGDFFKTMGWKGGVRGRHVCVQWNRETSRAEIGAGYRERQGGREHVYVHKLHIA